MPGLIKADANRQKGIEGEKGLPPEATGRAVEEYLAVLDDAAFGAATEVVPKFVSPAGSAPRNVSSVSRTSPGLSSTKRISVGVFLPLALGAATATLWPIRWLRVFPIEIRPD
jgi:hypothetical protein